LPLDDSLNKSLNSEIEYLKNELNNQNNIIKQKDLAIQELQYQLNNLNNLYNNNLTLIQQLKDELNQKTQELQKLKIQLDSNSYQFNNNYNRNKWGFAITFRSINQDFIHPMVCNEKESISRLEEELYNNYPKYKEFNTFLTCNGVVLKRFKTVGENRIKEGDAIIVNIME